MAEADHNFPKYYHPHQVHNSITLSASFLALSNAFFDTIQKINLSNLIYIKLDNNPIGSTGAKILSKK